MKDGILCVTEKQYLVDKSGKTCAERIAELEEALKRLKAHGEFVSDHVVVGITTKALAATKPEEEARRTPGRDTYEMGPMHG